MMSQKNLTRVVIAEDHQILLDSLVPLLNKEANIEVVGQAKNGKIALSLIREEQPDLAILDLEMPVMSGFDLVKVLQEEFVEIKILVLSYHKEEEYIREAAELGVDGYILKENGMNELVEAINEVMDGKSYFRNLVSQILVDSYRKEKAETESKEKEKANLTPREEEVLVLVAKGYPAAKIGEMLKIKEETVNTHKRNVREKLQITNAVSFVKYAVKHGYMNVDDIPDIEEENRGE